MTPPPDAPKPRLSEQVSDFVNNMDARAWRAVAVTFGLFLIVAIMLVTGRLFYGEEIEAFVRGTLGDAERLHWGLPAAIAVFTLTAFMGAPQFVLITACVVAFGPEVGFWYSWIATIVSGAVTFFAGKLSSNQATKRFGGATGGRFTRFMGQNSFWASFAVRFVPTAPFAVVNMAMAAAKAPFLAFIAGLAIGVLPKTAIVAFAGDGIMDAVEGNLGSAALMGGAAILLWFFGVVMIRRFISRNQDQDEA
ncbi:MAG: VTT domain-containing protein [Hyphomonadaceae bacterium]|nr:VTT domain-containing protein [Hyphomonadaceae bacterium]